MKEDLTCKLSMQTSKLQFAREAHFDIVNNVCIYMCKICENGEDPEQKCIEYSYLYLIDHGYSFHEKSPYIILNY